MTHSYTAIEIPMSQVFADAEFNCRGEIAPMDCVGLANDIKRDGLQSPISVQEWAGEPGKKYRIVAGHRRYTAFLINGSETIPAFIVHFDDELAARDYNLKENLHREPLNLLQEARALRPYFERKLTDKVIAERLQRSPGWVLPRRQLLELPEDIQQEAAKETINFTHVKSLFALRNKPEKMYEALRSIKEARERGEKVVHVKEDKDAISLTRVRKPQTHELNVLLDVVFNHLVSPSGVENFGARCLAYAAGSCSEADWWMALKRECERQGMPFNPPSDIAEVMGFNRANTVVS